MSHGLEEKNGTASFAYNKVNGDPWHRLGVAVDANMTIAEALKLSRGDYTVTKAPLYVIGDPKDPATFVFADDMATVRPDPDDDTKSQVLGVVGAGYEVVQNEEVLERAYAIVGASKNDAYLDTAGVLQNGKRFFAYLALGELIIDPTGIEDKIANGLAIYSSHDGSIAVTYAFTDIRSVCQNTVTIGVNTAQRVFRAKHTAAVAARMEEAQRVLQVSTVWAKEFSDMAEKMLSVKHTPDRMKKVLDRVFPLPAQPTKLQQNNNASIRESVVSIYGNERNEKYVGSNGWAIYNSVVEYVDHARDASVESRLNATMDPRDSAWANKKKLAAQAAVLEFA